MEQEEIMALALDLGFSHAGALNMASLLFLPEVREMCAADRCHSYGRGWTCPPACGTLEEAAEQAARYRHGVLVQSTGLLEDDFDIETIQKTEQTHKARFSALAERVLRACPDCLPLGVGSCTVCPRCTYPDEPCRHPDKAIPSMEAYGLLVSQVCEQSGLGYYYGRHTLTFTSCILIG